ncbi:MAG: SdrD B-like domain-containing protein [Ferruginibacter sp.]
MKHFVPILLFISLFSFTAKSQYVTIPDPALRDFMYGVAPSCFNGANMLDTTCPGILNQTELMLFSQVPAITNWDGFQYFKNLQVLNIMTSGIPTILPASLRKLTVYYVGGNLPDLPAGLTYLSVQQNNQMTSLPALPASLVYLYCNGNNALTTIGPLPASLKYLDCSDNTNLTSLPALPNSLDTLKCFWTRITTLPALPASLKYLDCNSVGGLTSLPALPAQLKYLDASYNNYGITAIPSLPAQLEYLNLTDGASGISSLPTLPSTLTTLNVGSIGLASLPTSLPAGLINFTCQGNQLTSLPTSLPAGLINFSCDHNQLSVLPAIPAGVTTFSCSGNQLTSIPTLPPALTYFDCAGNLLTSLPALPNTITNFYCNHNQLTSLPSVPASVVWMYCNNNQLTSLPPLPNAIQHLWCHENQLYFLPALPASLVDLKCYFNDLTCLPVIPEAPFMGFSMDIWIDDNVTCIPNYGKISGINVLHPNLTSDYYSTGFPPYFPLCSAVNNINHCDAFPLMAGQVFNDNNNNGTRDANEPYRSNVKVELSNGAFTFTNSNGYYEIPAPDTGTYTITVTPPIYYTSVPLQYNYHFTSYDTLVTGDFALQATTTIDSLSIGITNVNFARPGFQFPYVIAYSNGGTTTLSPNIVLNYDNTRLIYDSSSNAAVINTGNSLTLAEPGFVAGAQNNFVAYFRVNPAAVIGDSLRAYAHISGGTAAASDSNVVAIRGAYDPNDKTATPKLLPSQVINGDYINYTIRFQNTGNDTAFNVVITDTLNAFLQTASLQVLNTSHPCKITVKDNIVYFEFINILLPDSNVNQFKSHGYVNFRIKPQSNLVINNTIPNYAAIYFDYNSPVITNTAITTIVDPSTVPLTLISFTVNKAIGSTANVYWQTSNELNVNGYNIEMSSDGRNYKNIGFQKARGNQYDSYTRSVAIPNNDVLYFRLKMMDIDGNYNYSNIVTLKNDKTNIAFSFLSNPVKDELSISVNDADLKNTVAKIYNAQGGLVKTILLQHDVETIDIKSLPAGTYYLLTLKGSRQFVVIK